MPYQQSMYGKTNGLSVIMQTQSSANGVVFGHYSYDAPYDADGNANTRTIHASAPNPELQKTFF